MKTFLYLYIFFISFSLFSTPQIALQTANRCINCHLSESGSGLRNENGWRTVGKYSLIKPDWIGLKDFFDLTKLTNSALDGKLYFGADIRAQYSKTFKPGTQRKFFVKQVTGYVSYEVSDWLWLEGGYNFAETKYKNHGQQSWTAGVVLDPFPETPKVRIGHFQPGFGIRYDDHTMLIRMIANENVYANPLFAIDFSDFGIELYKDVYSPSPEWIFNLSGGVFSSNNLSKVKINSIEGAKNLTGEKNAIYVLKGMLSETIGMSDFTSSLAGMSILKTTDYTQFNYFAGISFFKRFSLLFEYSKGNKGDIFSLENYQGILNVKIIDPVYFEIRAERAKSNYKSLEILNTTQQLVFATQIFILPFIEVKQEFRLIDTEQNPREFTQYKGALYYLQLHLFY
ncbi:MAG: hypothetical protein N2319_09235 [Candidatus Kapabacteria bacterium]|nr:hypothetical protein [Candidatus Kapabacteria bacterium]